MKLSPTQQALLRALMAGGTLKAHRYLDGRKVVKLHPLDDQEAVKTVRRPTLEALRQHGLLDSNKKFPAATYLLTEKGKTVAAQLLSSSNNPLSAKNF